MRYLILIYSNPRSRAVWEELDDEQRTAFGVGHLRLTEEMAEAGELVVSEGLPGQETAKRVTVRDGATLTTDGPFAEVKEYLAGFYLVECESIDRAVEWAAKTPDARNTYVEVRPVYDLSGLEL